MPVKHHAKLACQDADEVVDSYNRFINEDCRKFVEFEVRRAQEDSKLTVSKIIKRSIRGGGLTALDLSLPSGNNPIQGRIILKIKKV